jgi:hypothetical protein
MSDEQGGGSDPDDGGEETAATDADTAQRREREVRRSDPDYRVYVPDTPEGRDTENQHFIVEPTPTGAFVAVWTQSSIENDDDQRVVAARSADGGETWSAPVEIDGRDADDPPGTGLASWGFPVVVEGVGEAGHRVYCFYNKNVGVDDAREDTTGVLRCRYSDDDGRTWSDVTHDFDIESCAISHPDDGVPESWIVYQAPTRTADGAVLAGFTHWASDTVDDAHIFERQSEIRFLRFEGLDAADPADATVTTWPDADHGLQVPHPDRPGVSVAQEPSVRPLGDGRLICAMRTLQGRVYFALSEDGGRTWDTPRPLSYDPEEFRPVENPIAPCPLYRLGDGRLLLVFYDNDGTGHGATGPTHIRRNRTPAWYALGEVIDYPTHPVRFDGPWILADNDCVAYGPNERTEIASYPSFFEHDGRAYLWYPDRKHFLLGKDLREDLDRRANL